MSTPIYRRTDLIQKLASILARPEYTSLLAKAVADNRFRADWKEQVWKLQQRQSLRKTGVGIPRLKIDDPVTPMDFAELAWRDAFGERNRPKLLNPVQVIEIAPNSRGSLHLYRVFDGNVAGTLGRWWCDEELLREIVKKVGVLNKPGAKEQVTSFMKSAMFVHPAWNPGIEVARMTIPQGASIPAIVGMGCWKAMKGVPDENGKYAVIHTAADLLDHYKMVAIPGPQQTFIPIVPDIRVARISRESANWPFSDR